MYNIFIQNIVSFFLKLQKSSSGMKLRSQTLSLSERLTKIARVLICLELNLLVRGSLNKGLGNLIFQLAFKS